jgi:predicted NBD/HSP70 family sugar kinase
MFVRTVNNQSPRHVRAAGHDDLRAHNTGLLLRAIWSETGLSRAELARRTGLARATVSDIVAGFVDLGVVSEAEAAPSNGGRPPIQLEFQDGWRHLIGLELGASHVSGVRTDLRGRVVGRFSVDLEVESDPIGTLAAMDAGIAELLALDADTPVLGIGLGAPSPLRTSAPGRLATHLYPRWAEIDLAAHLPAVHGLPALLDNDANLGALAEHWWGDGQAVADVAYIKLATGVGAGIVIGGDIHRGATGIAGEIGHTTIDMHGPRCRCGLNGCLEAFVGTSSLLARAAARLDAGRHNGPPVKLTVPGLIRLAHDGDPVARDVIATAGAWLGVAVANLLNLVNPAKVVLGGRLTDAGALLVDPMLHALAERSTWNTLAGSTVTISQLGDDAIALGAATLVLQSTLHDPSEFLTGAHPARPSPTPLAPRARVSA